MKRIFALVFCLVAVLSVSCQKEPSLTLSGPASLALGVSGDSQTLTFTTNRDWTVSSSDSWVTVSPSSGKGSDKPVTVKVNCSPNTTYDDRTATVTIRAEGLSRTVTVSQPANLGVVLPSKAFDIAADARSIEVEVQANVQYTVSVSADWIKQTGSKGLTSTRLMFSVEENTTYDVRSATITIKPQAAGVPEQVVSVKQAQKDAIIIGNTNYEMPYGGGEIEVKVDANVGFEVKSGADWIQYLETKALSGSTVRLKVEENTAYAEREGKVEIIQKGGGLSYTLTVKQAGRVAVTSVTLSSTDLSLMIGEASTLVATVKPDNATDKSVSWSSDTPEVAWVDEAGTVTAVALGTAKITATAGDKSATCTVSVDPPTLTVKDTEVEVPEEGGLVELDIAYNVDYTVEIDEPAQSWLSFIQTKALSGGKLQFQVAANDVDDIRKTSVTVTSESGADPVRIIFTQASKVRRLFTEFYKAMDGPSWDHHEGWCTDELLTSWEGIYYDFDANKYGLNTYRLGMKGEIPEMVGDFGTSIVRFCLIEEPGVTGTLPASFAKLTALKGLAFTSTSMTSLPDVFSGMTSLEMVEVSNNDKMGGPIPASIGDSPALTSMSICSNRFTGEIQASWARLGQGLKLSFNCLSGRIPDTYLTPEASKIFLKNDVLVAQREGYGFDIGDIDLYGWIFWPEQQVVDLNGHPFTMQDVIAKNKYTVHIFWATWCPFSKVLMPQLRDYYDRYHKDGLEVVATIAAGDGSGAAITEDKQRNAVAEKGYDKWINYFFWQQGPKMYPMEVPVAEVYDSEGRILFSSASKYPDPVRHRFGRTASAELIPFLESLLGPADTSEPYTSTDNSRDGEVLTLQEAEVGDGINLVFLGDGYTDRDMEPGGLYETVMSDAMYEFFNIEPYKTFRNRFNVYAVKAVSLNDRIGGEYSTAFSSYFGAGTMVGGNEEACYAYAKKVPGITDDKNLLICVMVNSPVSKGTTFMSSSRQSSVAFTTTIGNDGSAFGSTLRHEAGGHGFGFLADEYSTTYEAAPAEHIAEYNDAYEKYGWFSNVDFTDDPAKIRWSAFLSDARYKDEVGIFAGGALYSKGAWRPSQNSMMRDNLEYFNAPSRWAIYQRIMKLSGEACSFEKFLEYDAVNRGKSPAAVRPPLKLSERREPGAPPVIVR